MRANSEDDHDLGVDPCPDCDVRFNRETKMPIMAGTSILVKDRWKRRNFDDSVLLVGLPEHITCGILHKRRNHYEFEYFDPAGRDGDRKSVQKLKQWIELQLPKLKEASQICPVSAVFELSK